MAQNLQRGCQILRPLKWYRSLTAAAGRVEAGFCLVEGPRAIGQIIATHPDSIDEMLSDGSPQPASQNPIPIRRISPAQLASISNTKTPQGCIAVIRIPVESSSNTIPISASHRVLVLEDVQDPGNVGALIRTAVAFGYDGLVMSGKCADPYNPKAIQASAGSVFSLWIRRTEAYVALIDNLKSKGFYIVGTHIKGDINTGWTSQKRIALLLGNEGSGLSSEATSKADILFRIPISTNKIESLNVAASGAVCMYLSTPKQ
jgi:RNA methyltransferase, TrmH family